jgi:hypothetical protein
MDPIMCYRWFMSGLGGVVTSLEHGMKEGAPPPQDFAPEMEKFAERLLDLAKQADEKYPR